MSQVISNTLEEIIAVLQAFKDGKEIEYNLVGNSSDSTWLSGNPRWNFAEWHYRVKQELQKVKLLVYKDRKGRVGYLTHTPASRSYLKENKEVALQYAEVEVDVLFKPTSSL